MPSKIEKKAKAKVKYDSKTGLAIVTGDDFNVKIKLSTTQLSQMYFSGTLINTEVYLSVDTAEEESAPPPLAMPEMEIEEPVITEEPVADVTPIAIPEAKTEKTLDEVIKEAEEMIEGAAGPSPKKDEGDEEPLKEAEEAPHVSWNKSNEKSDIEKSFDYEVRRQSRPVRQNRSWKDWRGAYTGGKRGPFDSNN